MTNKNMTGAILKKESQSLGTRKALAVEVNLQHGIVVTPDNGRDFLVGLDDDVEIRPRHIFTISDLDGGNLDNVVVKNVQACSLGIEKHNLFIIEHLCKMM